MTQKQHFTQQEWDTVMKATALAGIGLIKADKSSLLNMIKELVAYASALVDAEAEYKSNNLLSIVIAELREDENHDFHRLQAEALQSDDKQEVLKLIEKAIDIIQKRASDTDFATYKHFLMRLLTKIAEAADEGMLSVNPTAISKNEQAFLDKVEALFA